MAGHRHWPLLLALALLLGFSTGVLALLPPASPPPKARGPAAVAPPPPPTTCGAPLTPPPAEHRPHQDSALDRLLIGLLADKLAELVQDGASSPSSSSSTSKRAPASFQDFALSTKALLAPRSADDLMSNQNAGGDAHLLRRSRQIAATLAGLVPPPLRVLFRATGKSRWACEAHALLAPLVSGWLVGPATRVEGEVEFAAGDGNERRREMWMSSTKIEQCRYFAESGCRKSCIYLCKIPTQAFFAETLGTPLTLTPDFEDGSCTMAFGQVPLPLDDDPVIQTTRKMGSCCGSSGPAVPVPASPAGGGAGGRASS